MAKSVKPESLNTKKPIELTRNQHVDEGVELYNYNAGVKEFMKELNADNVSIDKVDGYKGYVFAALRLRANSVARLATGNLCTYRREAESDNIHPYLELINKSKTDTNWNFFYAASIFLDLTGTTYLYVNRTVRDLADGRTVIGEAKSINVLNSYTMHPVIDKTTKQLIGYKQKSPAGSEHDVSFRLENIITVKLFNPFESIRGFATISAGEEAIYTKKESGKYTRKAMKNNINAPGILATEIQLNPADAENFKHSLKTKWSGGGVNSGSPIFANGSGALKWQDIKQDLDKMALETINNVNREELFAVLGVSKTKLGIEQSGVTRETSKVQDSQFMQDHAIPQMELITSALNQDFKNRYMRQYTPTRPTIVVKSPLGKDYEALKCEEEVDALKLQNVEKFIELGMSRQDAFELAGFDLPEDVLFDAQPESRRSLTRTQVVDTQPNPNVPTQNDHSHCSCEPSKSVEQNTLTQTSYDEIRKFRDLLVEDIASLESDLLEFYLENFQQNKVDNESDYRNQLFELLKKHWLQILPIFANINLGERQDELNLITDFVLSNAIKTQVEERLEKLVEKHFDVIDKSINKIIVEATEGGFSRTKTANRIKQQFESITDSSAKRIARTETNNAFMQAKFESDKQMIQEHSLQDRAYKKWVVNSTNPCPFCLALESEFNSRPIPFNENFRDLGSVVEAEFQLQDGTTSTRTLPVEFQDINAGTVHPNCSCSYELVFI